MATQNETDGAFSKPFTSEATGTNVQFWQDYCRARPSPTEDFFEKILEFHTTHSDGRRKIAHDVGAGPGNIAARLTPYFDKVVASDVNESALEAGPHMFSEIGHDKFVFIKAAAEELSDPKHLPTGAGLGETDLVVVGECMPLLDQTKSLNSFHALLRPLGTLAIYFYGRPMFAGSNAAECNSIYARIATRICQFYLPFKGTPGEPFHRQSAEALKSFLDNIRVDESQWAHIERHKWNNNRPMLFNDENGYDFQLEYVDRRGPTERSQDVIDPEFWSEMWDISRVKAYLVSNYPKHELAAGESYKELDPLYAQLEAAMGGANTKQKITFPVCLILASKH